MSVDDEDLVSPSTFKSMITRISRIRNSKHTISDPSASDISDSIRTTFNGQAFLQYDSGFSDLNRIVVFGTEKNLKTLENCKIVLMDGTFKSSPPGFTQLYTLMGQIKYVNVPLFILMKSKTKHLIKKYAIFWPKKFYNFLLLPLSRFRNSFSKCFSKKLF
jgi:hypothetical protein